MANNSAPSTANRHWPKAFFVKWSLVGLLLAEATVLTLPWFSCRSIVGGRPRAESEIKALSVACEAYKDDFGEYPRQAGVTEGGTASQESPIDPRVHGYPLTLAYRNASHFLYQRLSGVTDQTAPSGVSKATVYFEFRTTMLGGVPAGANPANARETFIQDPFGFSYGYSTAGASNESNYLDALAASPSAKRSATLHGYNSTFDLWSTAGKLRSDLPTDVDQANWIKNW